MKPKETEHTGIPASPGISIGHAYLYMRNQIKINSDVVADGDIEKELDEFKKVLVLQIRDIKSLRERLVESHKTTYEVDSSALPQQLAQSIRAAKFARYKVQVEEVSGEGVTLKVEAQ